MSAEIVAIARFVPRPEARDRVLAALERVTVATRTEPGCILLALHAGEGGDFLQVGRWETLEHWRAHGDAASVRELDRELVGLLGQDREIAWFRPLAVGEAGSKDASPTDGAPAIDVANADLLLSTTRSVRRRLDFDRPVEREVLLECLQLAVQAPTASNRQTWRWMVVTDPDLKARIADIYREEGMGHLRDSLVAADEAGDAPRRRVYESAVHLGENLERAPAFVIPCIAEDLGEKDHTGVTAALGSIIQAAWSFQLALRARGLGSTWTTIHLGQAQAVAELLGIPDGVTQVSLLPVAYTKGLDFRPAGRPPVTEITHWNDWGATGHS